MSQNRDFAARTGLALLTTQASKPVSPKQFRWRTAKSQKSLEITQKVEQYATQEAILKHTVSTLS